MIATCIAGPAARQISIVPFQDPAHLEPDPPFKFDGRLATLPSFRRHNPEVHFSHIANANLGSISRATESQFPDFPQKATGPPIYIARAPLDLELARIASGKT
jgi:hypothetical protein